MKALRRMGTSLAAALYSGIAFCIVTTNSVWGETQKYRSRVRLRAEAGVYARQPIEGKSYALQAR